MAQALVPRAGGTISSAILVPLIQRLIQQIDDVIRLEDNRDLLEEQLNHMKNLLVDINSQFQDQQRETPVPIKNCLLTMQRKVGEARELIHRSQRPRLLLCIDYLLCKPNVFKQIQEWNKAIPVLCDRLNAQQIALRAPQQADALLQDEPDTGFVGVDIETAEKNIETGNTESMQIQPLRPEEAWELFCKVAFEDGSVPEDLEHTARQVAEECKGLPLAIKVIAAAMIGNTAVEDWELALKQMQKVDSNFPLTHPRIDRELYQRMRWSYDSLPHPHLKSCFLYFAMLQEDASMEVDYLVHYWIAEGVVKTNEDAEYDDVFETGHSYVKLLEDRCLFQVGNGAITLHDVVRDMAIYIGENEENCVLRAGQSLQHFPDIKDPRNCKRISVSGNNLTSLSAKELKCPKLVSLFLDRNSELKEIPEAFFLNFPSLRVLDLLDVRMKSWPTSLWQLTQLEWLRLDLREIDEIPEDIGNLSNLQFLHLSCCENLKSLPSQIRELKNLKQLDMSFGSQSRRSVTRNLPNCTIVLHG